MARWNPRLHPRDAFGRFTRKLGSVSTEPGGRVVHSGLGRLTESRGPDVTFGTDPLRAEASFGYSKPVGKRVRVDVEGRARVERVRPQRSTLERTSKQPTLVDKISTGKKIKFGVNPPRGSGGGRKVRR